MIHALDAQGNITWHCTSCDTTYEHHISHGTIRWYGRPGMQPERMTISLPPCTCGRQTFLKAHFTPEELQAPNMID